MTKTNTPKSKQAVFATPIDGKEAPKTPSDGQSTAETGDRGLALPNSQSDSPSGTGAGMGDGAPATAAGTCTPENQSIREKKITRVVKWLNATYDTVSITMRGKMRLIAVASAEVDPPALKTLIATESDMVRWCDRAAKQATANVCNVEDFLAQEWPKAGEA